MKINGLRNLLDTLKATISDINYTQMIIDDSQMVKFMQNISRDQNLLLFCLVPDYNTQGTNNSVQTITVVQMLIFKKSYDSIEHDQFLSDMEETEQAGFKIKDYLVEARDTDCDLRFFKESEWQMSPIWNLASCNGYSINFNLPHNDE